MLAFGFARVRCSGCGRDELVAFPSEGRGFCPSCGARRMADTAARLVDEGLPDVSAAGLDLLGTATLDQSGPS